MCQLLELVLHILRSNNYSYITNIIHKSDNLTLFNKFVSILKV